MSTLVEYPEIDQRTPEWFEQRRGIVTASAVGQLITTRTLGGYDFHCPACGALAKTPCVSKAKAGSGAPIKTMHPERTEHAASAAETVLEPVGIDYKNPLVAQLVAERLTGCTDSTFMTDDMWRGVEEEPRARDRYAETNGVEVKTTGFMVREGNGWRLGYSPDGLVGDDGLIEIKAPRAKGHLQTVLNGEVPERNMAQLQAGLLVSGRKWCDFIPWFGGLPLWTKRVHPDPQWQAAILDAVVQFETTAAEMVAAYEQKTANLPATERLDLEIAI